MCLGEQRLGRKPAKAVGGMARETVIKENLGTWRYRGMEPKELIPRQGKAIEGVRAGQ